MTHYKNVQTSPDEVFPCHPEVTVAHLSLPPGPVSHCLGAVEKKKMFHYAHKVYVNRLRNY